ncbi:MAG TPA: nucleoside transporter C-terminal domain-containing protein [Burkholderiales bacterium]|nr:nucleoside transporter C-terminal domain-containing protein [Burkholderiales bacterium]
MSVLHGAFGFLAILLLAWLASEDRRAVPWRIVASGALLQLLLAAALLEVPLAREVFFLLNEALAALERATQAGTTFVFGYLGGGDPPFELRPGASSFVLAFRALPLVLVVSALSALLFHWGVLPAVVRAISAALEKTMGIGGAVGLSAAANIFVGMVEAPLLVRPYLREMNRGELFIVMSCGMAGIAGTVMALYAAILGPVVPDAMGHILSASIVSIPAAILIAAVMVPPRGAPTSGRLLAPQPAASSMDAVTRGALDGLQLLLNIVALLIVLVALVTLVNAALALLPHWGGAPVTLERLLGYLMAPLVWLAGVPWAEAQTAGALMGTKTVLNEFIAYHELARLPAEALSERSRLIMTYALCGFANFGSLGILIGGMATMAPERREEIVALGLRSILSGTLATLMVGAVVGMFV